MKNNEAGINTFEALEHANTAEVTQVLNSVGLQVMSPDGWIEQAELAAKDDWEGVKRL